MKRLISCSAQALLATWRAARTLDPSQPADAVEISKRAQCGAPTASPAVYHWSGKVYSRVAGRTRPSSVQWRGHEHPQCESTVDPKRGPRLAHGEPRDHAVPGPDDRARSCATGRTRGPGETVPVFHIANDPVNSRGYTFPIGADGKPYQIDVRRQGRLDGHAARSAAVLTATRWPVTIRSMSAARITRWRSSTSCPTRPRCSIRRIRPPTRRELGADFRLDAVDEDARAATAGS
jgi:hypothetical protein